MSSMANIDDYLAQGGVLTSPDNVPPRYRGELLRLMSSFVDSELAGSAGFADAINMAPGIKERIAASRIVLEKTDHAERVLDLMAEFGTDKARYNSAHDWAARLDRDAKVAARRQGADMRLAVFHLPLQGWIDAVAMNVLMGLATDIHLAEMAKVSYAPLAETIRDIRPREKRHTELGIEELGKVVADETGREEACVSVAYWRPRVADTFGEAQSQGFERLRAMGLRSRPNDELLHEWQAVANRQLQELGLA
ncbi:Phenylacetic acid catabolic protein [Notoacmeibacter sp. MSK16QG-6]|uniref:Phenylacetic acid catabolic protein n=1 Tax=Notoacmeibacter sp. MSK16QG-6 TaxID=2957982 RepID=UPI00209E58AC|nr:Phenylacetic acid catabolic protein [Notoacmeibacter sp. MSK16QG-6]MCP1200877.1 phenylacetate-CoA oxygenase subunit PaaI [Notoacmeibacter sp. MSK16QG-6]